MQPHKKQSQRLLEVTMRNVMDNLEEMVCQQAIYSDTDCFEILSIESPRAIAPSQRTKVIDLVDLLKTA